MYRHITSNKSPYKKITYYTSYGDKVAHVHKNSEAYKFFTSSIYKNAIKVGKVTNVVMPLISDVLTGYIVYKKYITNNPNKFNNHRKIYVVEGTSYDAKKLFKTQPKQFTKETGIKNVMQQIETKGINSIDPIPVYVHEGKALIVDGHHRYEACVRLGVKRVSIKYIHKNQIPKYHRTLNDLIALMYK